MKRFYSTSKVKIHGRGEIFAIDVLCDEYLPKKDEIVYINDTLYKVETIEKNCLVGDPFKDKGCTGILAQKIDNPLHIVKNP